ncbi:MAG TPA: hypothetical protein VFV35_01695 [Acidimicrobiales bacterium]|nr:hypothetical protein [Acidimicrobiales bacterium]
MVLILLAAIWAAFLLPPILRARAENRPSGSITDFRRQLRTLARTSPSAVATRTVGPSNAAVGARSRPVRHLPAQSQPVGLSRSRRAVKRRRDIFVGLLVAMAGSLVLGFLPPLRALWALHVALDVLFAAYVGLLVYLRNLAVERELKVRFLPTTARSRQAEAVLAYRRSGT